MKNADGSIKELLCTYDPDTRSGSGFEGRKVKGTIHFVDAKNAVEIKIRKYGYLMLDKEDGTSEMNPNSLVEVTAIAEKSIEDAKAGEAFQFFRHGYYVADSKLFSKDNLVFNQIVDLKSSWKK